MYNNVPNPIKFNKKVFQLFKNFYVSISDIIWFLVISLALIPTMALIDITWLQIFLAIFYILIIFIVLWRWDGVWLRDLIWISIKYFFSKKTFNNKEAKTKTFIGAKDINGYYKKENTYSKYYKITASDISLIRDIELDNRITKLNDFFMFSDSVKFNILVSDKIIDVSEDIKWIENYNSGENKIYDLLNFDRYNSFKNIELNGLSSRLYILEIKANKTNLIDKAYQLAKNRISGANISLDEATNEDLINFYETIFAKKFSIKKFEENKNIYSNVNSIYFNANFYRVTFKKQKEDEKNKRQYFKILSVSKNPQYADHLWIASLYNIDGVSIFHKLKQNNIKDAKSYISQTSRWLAIKFGANKKDMISQNETIKYYEQIQETSDWIANGNCSLIDSELYFIVTANTKKKLLKKVGLLKEICRSNKCKLDTNKFCQKVAFEKIMEV